MRTRTALTAAALAVATALTLTACGDSDDGGAGKIEGAKDGGAEKSASPSTGPAKDTPDVSLPKDIKLVFDWEAPSDPAEATALRDVENYIRSIYRGIAQQTPGDPAPVFYSRGQALSYAQDQIKKSVDAGLTATGSERFYRAETETNGSSVGISFCANQAEIYSKKVKTGKVLRTEPSDSSYLYYQVNMAKYPGREDVWQATAIVVEGEATQCKV